MIIYHDAVNGHTLTRVYSGKRINRYSAYIFGWYAGGFSAKTDMAALTIFREMLRSETEVRQK